MRRARPIRQVSVLAAAAAASAESRLARMCSALAGPQVATPTPTARHHRQHRQQQQQQTGAGTPAVGSSSATTTTKSPRQRQHPPPACARLHTLARPSFSAASAAAAAASPSSSASAAAAAAAAQAAQAQAQSSSRAREAQRQRERLDVKIDAQVTFDACWRRFEARHPDFATRARVPREVIFLQGAPASGKGTHTPAIVEARALARVVSVSGVLKAFPEARALMDRGEMIDDALVADALLEALLAPPTPQEVEAVVAPVAAACPPPNTAADVAGGGGAAAAALASGPTTTTTNNTTTASAAAVLAPAPGVLVDGFPRTSTQVDVLKLLHERLLSLHDAAAESAAAAAEEGGGGGGGSGHGAAAQEAAARFPRVAFRVVALFVDEATSLARQQGRAHRTAQHNLRVLDAASVVAPQSSRPIPAPAAASALVDDDDSAPRHDDAAANPHQAPSDLPIPLAAAASAAGGDLLGLDAPRATDADLERAKQRYSVFRAHYPALLRLRAFLPFHLVDASGDEDDVRDAVLSELRYQSSVELSAGAYGVVRSLPLASDLQAAARQALVSRLDGYAAQRPALLAEVAALLRREAVPVLTRAGLVGRAEWTTRAAIFEAEGGAGGNGDAAASSASGGGATGAGAGPPSSSTSSPIASPSPSFCPPAAGAAVDMVVDLLADRGFQASHSREEQLVPTRFDPSTGVVLDYAPRLICHRFSITFDAPGVRQLRAMETAARVAETAGGGAASAFAAAVARRPSPAQLGAAVERVHQRLAERERERREAHARALRELEEQEKQQEQDQQQRAASA